MNWYESPNMPWIISLIISLITVLINIYISRINQRTALQNLDKQITASTDTSKQQIENSKEIALAQIKNSQILAVNEFNTTLKTKNRQDWVNDLRMTVSELLTNSKLLNAEFQASEEDVIRKKGLHEKVTLNRIRVLLLLNNKKEDHNNLLNSLSELIDLLDDHLLNAKHNFGKFDNASFIKKTDKVINIARDLLYKEWKKIQDGPTNEPLNS